jgi:hypothetical protein
LITSPTANRHVGTACPSTNTLQEPHCSSPQPNFGPDNPQSLRSTYNKGVSGSTLTVIRLPLTFRVMVSGIDRPLVGADTISQQNHSFAQGLLASLARVKASRTATITPALRVYCIRSATSKPCRKKSRGARWNHRGNKNRFSSGGSSKVSFHDLNGIRPIR